MSRFSAEAIDAMESRLAAWRAEQDDELKRPLVGDPCAYCGGPTETRFRRRPTKLVGYDHIVPRSAGGDDSWENATACCVSCNSAKGAKPLLLFLAHRNGCWQEIASQ